MRAIVLWAAQNRDRYRSSDHSSSDGFESWSADEPGIYPAPVPVTAGTLRDWYKTARMSDAEIEAMERYVGIAMIAVLPAFSDPKLPTFLRECRWGIMSALAENRKTA